MVAVLFEVLLVGLKIWHDKQATKYIDEVVKLQKEWLEEYNKELWYEGATEKPSHYRDNNVIDSIEQQLHVIGKIYASTAGKQNS